METRRFEASWPSLTVAERWVADACRNLALPGDAAYALQASCEELSTNVVRHGDRQKDQPPGDDDLWFELAINRTHAIVTLTISDNTAAFDTAAAIAAAGRTAGPDFQIGGLGLTLIKSLAAAVSYRRHDGQNETRLDFRLSEEGPTVEEKPA
ncbi:MAG: ATP-binding protein [Proteobacteria bacterium]|nr:ATP-binding protein [Pseudomonadota bacterium]